MTTVSTLPQSRERLEREITHVSRSGAPRWIGGETSVDECSQLGRPTVRKRWKRRARRRATGKGLPAGGFVERDAQRKHIRARRRLLAGKHV